MKCAKIADEKKGENILIFDIRDISNITDYFVFITGSVDKHVKAIVDDIDHIIKKELGLRLYHKEGVSQSNWVVLDYIDVVVHVFTPETREYYNLERLWGDAKKVMKK